MLVRNYLASPIVMRLNPDDFWHTKKGNKTAKQNIENQMTQILTRLTSEHAHQMIDLKALVKTFDQLEKLSEYLHIDRRSSLKIDMVRSRLV